MAILTMGYRYRVGGGNISIWYDFWLEDGKLCNMVPIVHIEDTQKLIKDVYFDGK